MKDAPPVKDDGLGRRALKRVGAAWRTVGSTVAGIAALLALTFSINPQWIPDPRSSLDATMEVQSLEHHVRFDDYLYRIFDKEPAGTLAKTRGTIVNLQINVSGRKHSGLRLYQYLYRVSDRRRLDDQPRSEAQDSRFEPDTPKDQWIQPVWITNFYASTEKHVFARLELYDEQTLLAAVETKELGDPSEPER